MEKVHVVKDENMSSLTRWPMSSLLSIGIATPGAMAIKHSFAYFNVISHQLWVFVIGVFAYGYLASFFMLSEYSTRTNLKIKWCFFLFLNYILMVCVSDMFLYLYGKSSWFWEAVWLIGFVCLGALTRSFWGGVKLSSNSRILVYLISCYLILRISHFIAFIIEVSRGNVFQELIFWNHLIGLTPG